MRIQTRFSMDDRGASLLTSPPKGSGSMVGIFRCITIFPRYSIELNFRSILRFLDETSSTYSFFDKTFQMVEVDFQTHWTGAVSPTTSDVSSNSLVDYIFRL